MTVLRTNRGNRTIAPNDFTVYLLCLSAEKGYADFKIRETRPGFSLDHRALPCYCMEKKSGNDEVEK